MANWILIYDDLCPVCRAGVSKVRDWDLRGVLRIVPLSRGGELDDAQLPPFAELQRAIHAISPEGEVLQGADVIALIGLLSPRFRFLGWALRLPLIRGAARSVYWLVARNRMRIARIPKADR